MIKTVEWTKDGVRMLDQRVLPAEETYLMLRSYEEVAEAIKKEHRRSVSRQQWVSLSAPASQSELQLQISKTTCSTSVK
jgi:methylthioribose-1-phosphate isomerase